MVIAIIGYKLVLRVEKFAYYATLINLIFLTIAAVTITRQSCKKILCAFWLNS